MTSPQAGITVIRSIKVISFHSLVAMHAQSKILAYKNQLQLPVTPSLWTWRGEFLNLAYPRPILSKFYSILFYPYLRTANLNSYHFRADTM